MAKQLLIYDSAVPVSSGRHREWCIERRPYSFASNINSVPLTAVEIPHAAREYAIVFAGTDSVVPVVLLGAVGNNNDYLAEDGSWRAEYVPAFIRRYPFVFSLTEDKSRFALCIDEQWAGCNQEGRGERLFDSQGERTGYLNQMLKFLEEYQVQFNRTQAHCRKLKELGLLEPMQAEFTLSDGTKRQLVGFQVISREKLKALPAETLAELAKTDELELIYDHLLSMHNFGVLAKRAAARMASDQAAPSPPPAHPGDATEEA